MNRFLMILAGILFAGVLYAQTHATYPTEDVFVRDPFILTNFELKEYYLYRTAMIDGEDGRKRSGVEMLVSKDLKNWTGPQTVFITPDDNWITGRIWAPEVHEYRGKYYLFATMNSNVEWKKRKEGWPAYTFRGTQIFWSDSPGGPFKAFGKKIPHTPMDRMALDGTLWVEDDKPYMIYCHEWVQIEDGTMELVQLKEDLSDVAGLSLTLFNASAAAWSTGHHYEDGAVSYVTDGCFLYRTKENRLLMIWSSFKDGSYAIGIAESLTGKVAGPWKQQEKPLFEKNGGHGMLFRDLSGRLLLTFHSPNSPSGSERANIYEVIDEGDTLSLGDRVQ